MLKRLAELLAGRYTLESEIGRGGMAVVYRAHDVRHDRTVALKVMREDLVTLIGPERFLREIRITARLNHPHILPLLDSGEADGRLFYVMPYVEGRSLRELIRREGRLDADVAIRVARQVASALDHAHRLGIVHRDIKPENILLSDGLATVADFGVAQALSTVAPQRLTGTGLQLGTFGYMSPEQAAGATSLDARTDVYSLAVVVYEMLVGEPPRHWVTDQATTMGRFIDAVPEHRAVLDRLHGRIEQALVRAMAFTPAARFASAVAFVSALETAAGGSATVSDERVQSILRRAAELELDEAPREAALSMGALEQVAAEAGIRPAHVRRAAGELDRREAARVASSAPPAGKDSVVIDRVAAGEPDPARSALLIEEVQAFLGITGHVSAIGRTITWSPAAAGTESRKLVVTLTPRGGETRIHLEERFELAGPRLMIPALGAFAMIMLVMVAAAVLGVADSTLVTLPLLLGGGAGGVLSATGYLRHQRERRRPELEALAERLAALVEGTD